MTLMDVLQRALRGLQGLTEGKITLVGYQAAYTPHGQAHIWTVKSSQIYYVGHIPQERLWRCTCPDFAKRGGPCKHILLAMLDFELRFARLATLVVEEEGRS